jgi:two-component system, LytTR family, sensor kinase
MKLSFLSGKKLYILLHVLVCAVLLILPLYLTGSYSGRNYMFVKSLYLRTFVYLFLFYLNYLWLVPKFLFTGKIKTFFAALIISASFSFFIMETGHDLLMKDIQRNQEMNQLFEKLEKENVIPRMPPKRFIVYSYILTTLVISGLSIGLRMSGRLIQNEKEKKELERERLNTELAFLKNQVSPHFFFNTLNNIYSLIELNTKEAQEAVLKLSKLMRYLLYESEQGDTKLSRELEFMQNYIDLMRLRLTNKVSLQVVFPEQVPNMSISPLLFIPFIENAFKHGVSYRDKSFIEIALLVDKDEIIFKSSNSKGQKNIEDMQSGSGIGLENIKKRLALIYPGKHNLQITDSTDRFDVLLKISLS